MAKYWIMRSSYLKIHPLTILFLFIAFLTGYFQYIFYMMSLIFIHEIGHVTFALFFGWNVKKIVLLPFGGITIFEEMVNRPIKEEFFIVLAGPIYQQFFYGILTILGYRTPLLTTIHYFILGFNFLPIYPLDGSKILLLFFEKFFSFYHSHSLLFTTSMIMISLFFGILRSFLFVLLTLFLLVQVWRFYKNIKPIYYKFVLERKLYSFSFQKQKRIQYIKQMKRDYQHYFIKNGRIYSEKEYLRKWDFL